MCMAYWGMPYIFKIPHMHHTHPIHGAHKYHTCPIHGSPIHWHVLYVPYIFHRYHKHHMCVTCTRHVHVVYTSVCVIYMSLYLFVHVFCQCCMPINLTIYGSNFEETEQSSIASSPRTQTICYWGSPPRGPEDNTALVPWEVSIWEATMQCDGLPLNSQA